MEHRHAHSFVIVWLVWCHNSRVENLWQRLYGLQAWNIYYIALYKKFAKSCSIRCSKFLLSYQTQCTVMALCLGELLHLQMESFSTCKIWRRFIVISLFLCFFFMEIGYLKEEIDSNQSFFFTLFLWNLNQELLWTISFFKIIHFRLTYINSSDT